MNTFSGTLSDFFSPNLASSNGAAASAVAPAPQDPSATFSDVLEQEQGGSPVVWPIPASAIPAGPAGALTPFATVLNSDPAPGADAPAVPASLPLPEPALAPFGPRGFKGGKGRASGWGGGQMSRLSMR